MKIDLRVLAVVAGCMVVAASAVVMARYAEKARSPLLVERINPGGVPTTSVSDGTMLLQVRADGIVLAFPGCEVTAYKDKFFLHVYPEKKSAGMDADYVNMDFNLVQEKGKETQFSGSKACLYEKKFPEGAVKKFVFGQFTMLDGQCCQIKWSRSFIFDIALQKK
jgi:hypothetical protein